MGSRIAARCVALSCSGTGSRTWSKSSTGILDCTQGGLERSVGFEQRPKRRLPGGLCHDRPMRRREQILELMVDSEKHMAGRARDEEWFFTVACAVRQGSRRVLKSSSVWPLWGGGHTCCAPWLLEYYGGKRTRMMAVVEEHKGCDPESLARRGSTMTTQWGEGASTTDTHSIGRPEAHPLTS